MSPLAETQGHAWALLLQAQACLVEAVEADLAAAGLPPLAWYDVLWELEKAGQGRLRMHDVARRVVLSRSNLSRLADRLQEAGLIERRDSADDGRGYDVVLTRKGRSMRRKIWPVYAAAIERLFARHVSSEEARLIGEVLERVVRAARSG